MKLPIQPLTWLLTSTVIYVIIGLINLFIVKFTELEFIQFIWLTILSLPVLVPMNKIVDIDPFWKKK